MQSTGRSYQERHQLPLAPDMHVVAGLVLLHTVGQSSTRQLAAPCCQLVFMGFFRVHELGSAGTRTGQLEFPDCPTVQQLLYRYTCRVYSCCGLDWKPCTGGPSQMHNPIWMGIKQRGHILLTTITASMRMATSLTRPMQARTECPRHKPLMQCTYAPQQFRLQCVVDSSESASSKKWLRSH